MTPPRLNDYRLDKMLMESISAAIVIERLLAKS
jgi:hypothetical protein